MTDSEMPTPPSPKAPDTKPAGMPPPPRPQKQSGFAAPPPPASQPGAGQMPPPLTQPTPSVAPARPPQLGGATMAPANAAGQTHETPAPQPEMNAQRPDFLEPLRLIAQNRQVLISFLVIFVLGLFMGSCLFSAPKKQKVQQAPVGLTGVVPNPEPNVANMKRCGQVERGQPCIIYIVNHSRYEKYAENFFDEASRLTEVSRHSISMDNLQYAKTLIRSGEIAQIKVPSL